MQSRGSSARLPSLGPRSRISTVIFAMFATMASLYVAGRLWQDAENRVYLIKELDRRTGKGQSAVTVDDTLKLLGCREQQKRLAALEMEMSAARHEGFVPKHDATRKRMKVVIGIMTTFGGRSKRDALRRTWVPRGAALKKLENDRDIVIRFVIGRSANRGDSHDRNIDEENRQTNDFIILDNLVEGPEELPKKTKVFFSCASDTWDAEFYAKVNDNIKINLDGLNSILTTHLDKPRVYIGCMKSGEVFSEPNHKWYEPDWWKFGDNKSYFRHAYGELVVVSRALAQFISINRSILCTYAHDDVSIGSWMIGLKVDYIDEGKFCCSYWTTGAVCGAV